MTEAMATYHPTAKTAHSGSTRILSDRARCHDGQCSVRNQCERWLDRNAGHGDHIIHAATLRERWLCHTEPCSAYVGPALPETEQ